MRHIAFSAVLVCAFTACSDRPSPVDPGSAAAPIAIVRAQGRLTDVHQIFTVEFCAFPILVELNGKSETIQLPGGRTIMIAPSLTATLTNLDKANQAAFVITGAFHQRLLANGDVETVATGRNALFDPLVPGLVGLVVTVGRFSWVVDQKNNLVQPLQGTGQLIDVCKLLA
jgi:hypothetical protein